jgi:hypothetical protein
MSLPADPEQRYPRVISERMKIIDEMIEAGWGSVPQRLIPKNWREVPGPYLDFQDDEIPERIDNMRETESLWSKRAAARAAGE